MNTKAMSLKGKIKNYAKKNDIAAQVVLQNYMFECFLLRLAESPYNEKFIVKGELLIAAIVGLDTRATMDLDTTIRGLPLTQDKISEAINAICEVNVRDEVSFQMKSIREGDFYGGYCVKLEAVYDTIITPLSIDVSTGDIITPAAVRYEFRGIFDETIKIKLWGYNIETIIAEKIETILSRGVFTTRPRDFYDIYILGTTQKYEKRVLDEALESTAKHRGSLYKITEKEAIIKQVKESDELRQIWGKYQNKFSYAKDISYESTIEILEELVNCK